MNKRFAIPESIRNECLARSSTDSDLVKKLRPIIEEMQRVVNIQNSLQMQRITNQDEMVRIARKALPELESHPIRFDIDSMEIVIVEEESQQQEEL